MHPLYVVVTTARELGTSHSVNLTTHYMQLSTVSGTELVYVDFEMLSAHCVLLPLRDLLCVGKADIYETIC